MCHIDIHTHIMPANMPHWVKKFGYDGFIHVEQRSQCEADMMIGDKFFRKVGPNSWDENVRIEEMLATGIKKQVLSTVPVLFNYWAKPEDTYQTSQFFNDHIATICRNKPEHFIGLGTLPMQDPELAIRELDRCINDLGLQGIQIGSHINKWNLENKELWPIYKRAEELNACIFVHPWDMMGEEDMEKYWLPWLVGMPAESSRAISSLIFGGVFENFPNLRFAFAHGGGSFPFTLGRIKHGFDVRPDLCAIDNKISPDKYIGHFWVDSLVHDMRSLNYNIDLFGSDKIAFGSDYPYPLGDLTGGTWMNSLDSEILHKIRSQNALDWLGMN